MNLIFDVHLDLSMNALEWNRDLTLSIPEMREREQGMNDLKGRGGNTVNFESMRNGGVGLCVATQIGGCMKPAGPVASWESPAQAWAMTQGQHAYYEAMTDLGEMTPIRNLEELDRHLPLWEDPIEAAKRKEPIGFIMSLEGADSIITLDYLDKSFEKGLRALGPAHYGKGRYALGHDQDGGLPANGQDLLRKMEDLNLILDATHLSDGCFFEALDIFGGTVWASHSNSRSVVELAGNSDHTGIGSDLDGGFGREQSPTDIDTIADLQKLESILSKRGYTSEDISKIFHRNFLRLLRNAWS